MSTSITKGPAFEIRFCEGNKVQVFDLSKRGVQNGNQLLPSEYLEDDVVNGRLRYSKLGNQWLSDDAGTSQHHQQTLAAVPDDQNHTTSTKLENDNHDVIPVVAKRKAIEDAKELESIRQGEEAMRKAMERKKKIEMLRRARQQAKEKAEAATTDSSQVDHTNKKDSMDMKKEQDTQPQFEHEKDLTFTTEMNNWTGSAKTNQTTTPILTQLNSNNLRDSGTSINTDNNNSNESHSVNKMPSYSSHPSPMPPRTTSSSPVQQPLSVHHQQSISQHYYPQKQPQQHGYTGQVNQVNYQASLEDSFFHQDISGDKNHPPSSSSSSCCCVIS